MLLRSRLFRSRVTFKVANSNHLPVITVHFPIGQPTLGREPFSKELQIWCMVNKEIKEMSFTSTMFILLSKLKWPRKIHLIWGIPHCISEGNTLSAKIVFNDWYCLEWEAYKGNGIYAYMHTYMYTCRRRNWRKFPYLIPMPVYDRLHSRVKSVWVPWYKTSQK